VSRCHPHLPPRTATPSLRGHTRLAGGSIPSRTTLAQEYYGLYSWLVEFVYFAGLMGVLPRGRRRIDRYNNPCQVMPTGANRVRRLPAEVAQPALAHREMPLLRGRGDDRRPQARRVPGISGLLTPPPVPGSGGRSIRIPKRDRIPQAIEPAQAQAKDWPPCPSPPPQERPP
jgi:hypothetical protein